MKLLAPILAFIYVYIWTHGLNTKITEVVTSTLELRSGYTDYFIAGTLKRVIGSIPILIIAWLLFKDLKKAFSLPKFHRKKLIIFCIIGISLLTASTFIDKIQNPHIGTLPIIAWGCLYLLTIGIFEEVIFRYMIFGTLLEKFGFIKALLVSSALFFIAHHSTFHFNSALNALLFLLVAFSVSYLCSITYLYFGRSIIPPILMHAIIDIPILQDPRHIQGITLPYFILGSLFVALISIYCSKSIFRPMRIAQQAVGANGRQQEAANH